MLAAALPSRAKRAPRGKGRTMHVQENPPCKEHALVCSGLRDYRLTLSNAELKKHNVFDTVVRGLIFPNTAMGQGQ